MLFPAFYSRNRSHGIQLSFKKKKAIQTCTCQNCLKKTCHRWMQGGVPQPGPVSSTLCVLCSI